MAHVGEAQCDGTPAQEGATSTEYLFLLVFIALAILGGAQAYGIVLGGSFSDAASDVAESAGSG